MQMFFRTMMLFCVCAVALAAQSTSKQLPPPFHTPSVDNRSQMIPQPAGAKAKVPDGFTVDVAAEGFETPRFMLLGPGQEILMSDSARATREDGSVYVLLDKDRDGKIEAEDEDHRGARTSVRPRAVEGLPLRRRADLAQALQVRREGDEGHEPRRGGRVA